MSADAPPRSGLRAFVRLVREELGLTKAHLAGIIAVFWTVVAVSIFVQSSVLHRLFGMAEMALVDRIQYVIRWTLWALLTPLVISLAVRFPFRRQQWPKWLGLHLVFAVGTLLLEFLVEMPIIRTIASKGFGIHDPLRAFITPFITKFNLYLILYFTLNGFVNVLLYFTRYRQAELQAARLNRDLSQAQLETLRSQLQPHFLFNAHHAIVGLIAKGESDKAITMLTQLSELLRTTIDQRGTQVVTLARELELLDLFLAIQRTRFGDRLRVERNIAPECLQVEVPGLLLQPIVENAVRHGLANVEQGSIDIRAEQQNGSLVLSVRDNGAGPPAQPSEGTGLRNTRERLERLYDGAATFSMNAATDGPGTLVRITIPLPI
jgi:two-component system LytT family sensor kinase